MMLKKLIFTAILFIIFSSYAYGYGMASSYLEDRKMHLLPGEEKEYVIEIQNTDDAEILFEFWVEGDVAYLKETEDEFWVGGENPLKKVHLLVMMPENAVPGTEYKIRYGIIPKTASMNQINLNILFNDEFTAISIPKDIPEEKEKNNILPYLLLVVISAAVIYLLFKKNSQIISKLLKK